jgi:SAM-dependent methyltransferase
MAFRTFNSRAEAAEYAASLDQRWPMRAEVQAHLSHQLAPLAGAAVHVAELCAGAGALAGRLLADYPDLHYTGVDISAPLLALAQERLARYAARTAWVEADLNGEAWLAHLPHPLAAIVSLQSLHDLGDAAAVARIYRLARERLAPGGRLVFADLLAAGPPDPTANPGRLGVAAHLAHLAAAGFPTPRCTLELDPFGCFVAEAP